jgi:hypothetical protein
MNKTYELEEKAYKGDFQICDLYISFSSELLRLSLLALGAYGTLITIFLKSDQPELFPVRHSWGLLVAAILFSLCAGATLVHRFEASDSMACYLAMLRKLENDDPEKEKEKKDFDRALAISRYALILVEFLFGFAVFFFIIGILQLLFLS